MLPTSTRHWSRLFKTAFPRPPTRFLSCSTHNASPRALKTSHDRPIAPVPSFREELVRTSEVKPFSERLERPSVKNQVIVSTPSGGKTIRAHLTVLRFQFFVVGSYIAFSCAATFTNDDTNYWVSKLTGMSLVWKDRLPTNDEIFRTKYYDLAKVSIAIRLATVVHLKASRITLAVAKKGDGPERRNSRASVVSQRPHHQHLRSVGTALSRLVGWQADMLENMCNQHSGLDRMAYTTSPEFHERPIHVSSAVRTIVHSIDQYVQVWSLFLPPPRLSGSIESFLVIKASSIWFSTAWR